MYGGRWRPALVVVVVVVVAAAAAVVAAAVAVAVVVVFLLVMAVLLVLERCHVFASVDVAVAIHVATSARCHTSNGVLPFHLTRCCWLVAAFGSTDLARARRR